MLKPFLRTAIAAAALAFAAMPAMAQSGILVVDMQKVYSDSKVGKHITSRMKSLAATDEATIKSQASSLESTMKSLRPQLEGKSQQDILSNASLKTQLESFGKRQGELQSTARKKQAELALTRNKALGTVNTQVKSVLEQIAKERGAAAVMEAGSVLYIPDSSSADITATVIQRLDQRMTTTPVTRQSLPTR